jgi:uncharacterized protein YciI
MAFRAARAYHRRTPGPLCSAPSPHEAGAAVIFVFHLLDKPDSAALRSTIRPAHKAYLALVADRMAFAGPLLSDDGKTMIGSLLAIDFANREAAEKWQADEPFTRAGVYASSSVLPFTNLWPQKAGFPPAE